MQNSSPGLRFISFKQEYLISPVVQIAFWSSLVGGVAGLLITALWLHGTRWEVVTAVAGGVSLLDAFILRYAYEIKRAVRELHGYFADACSGENQ